MPVSKDILTKLHEEFYGVQDDFIDKMIKGSINKKETRTFTFDCSKRSKRYNHTFDGKLNDYYTNFKISPASVLKYLSLEVGGQEFENLKLFRFLGTEPEFYQMSGGRMLPHLLYHDNIIRFETVPTYTGNITVSYDVITKDDNEQIYQEQYTGTECLSDSTESNIKLNYNHPIVKIYAFIETDDVEDVRIILNDVDHGLILDKNEIGKDGKQYYSIEFGDDTSLNFSKIDKPYIKITTKVPHPEMDANIVAIGKQIIQRKGGYAAARYSK